MYPLIYLFSLAAGVCFLVKLYILEFDQHTEKELIRLSFYWVPFILFGLLGLTGRGAKKIKNHLVFALAGTLVGIVALAGFVMLFFLS
jgi:hypothetical protein